MSYDILEAVSNILQIVIYLFFTFASQKYITKGENSKLDAYLFATLVLVGLSVAVIQLDNVYYMISWGHSLPDSFDILVSGYPNQYFESWNLQDPKRAIKRVQICLGIASFILATLTIAIYLGYFLIDNVHMDDPTIGDISQNSWELRIIVFTYSIYSNGGIIIAYFILYLKLRGVYDQMSPLLTRAKAVWHRMKNRTLCDKVQGVYPFYFYRYARSMSSASSETSVSS